MPAYKNNDRGTWYASFYYRDWTGVNRRKKKEGFKTKREALDFEREFIKQQGGDLDMLFSAVVDIYLADCRTRLRASTCEGKHFIFENKLLPVFGNMRLNEILPATVRQWQNELISEEEYAPTYLRSINSQLSAVMNYAVRYYGLRVNPVKVAGTIGKNRADAMQFWTEKDFELFLDVISDKPVSAVMFQVLFWTGVRVGELLALTLSDVDFIKKTITISKSFSVLNGVEIISQPKTSKSIRVITVPDFLLAVLQEYAGRLYDYDPSERLFLKTKSYLSREIARGSTVARIKKIRVHDLRHSHASYLIEHGFSALVVSERLGHESVQTTLETYAHLYPNKHGEVASYLDAERTKNVLKNSEDVNNGGNSDNGDNENK